VLEGKDILHHMASRTKQDRFNLQVTVKTVWAFSFFLIRCSNISHIISQFVEPRKKEVML
jgi:hypothetical protein